MVAIVDAAHRDTKARLDYLAAENYQIKVSESFDRDPSEGADVGAYIAAIDGSRLEPARKLLARIRSIGFQTVLWALADSHSISNLAVAGGPGEVDNYIYLGQQTPVSYGKQVISTLVKYGGESVAAILRWLDGLRCRRHSRLWLPGPSVRRAHQVSHLCRA